MFTKVSQLLAVLVGAIFLGRIVFITIRVGASYEYFEVLQDTVLYFVWTSMFPLVVTYMFDTIHSVSDGLKPPPRTDTASFIVDSVASKLFGYAFPSSGILGAVFLCKFAIIGYSILIGLLLSIAPIIIFLNVLLGISHGLRSYFSILMGTALWPILWNLLGLLSFELWDQIPETKLSAVVFWIVIQILQVFSPLFSIMLFRSLSVDGAVSRIKGMVT